MRNEPCWLTTEDVIALNRVVVGSTNEPFAILSGVALDSAVARPRNHFLYDEEDDALSLAVTLLFGIARNHAFEQGNKRTALEAAIIFLNANGYDLEVPDGDAFAQIVLDIVDHKVTEQQVENALRVFMVEMAEHPVDLDT